MGVTKDTDVQPMPSLPPSPTTEEDLSRAQAWSDGNGESDGSESELRQKRDRRKGKEKESATERPYIRVTGSDDSLEQQQDIDAYPPTNDDVTETRRVEEVRSFISLTKNNLKKYRIY
jgi:hypothetical protein